MKEIQRIPATEEHLGLVWHYGVIRGFEIMISKMNYTNKERELAMKMIYEKNIKPTADLVRSVLGVDNAIGFDPLVMGFIVYDKKPDEVNCEIATDHWEKEYGRKFLEPRKESSEEQC